MGISYDKMGALSKDDLDNNRSPSKQQNSEILNKKRNNSDHTKQNTSLINKYKPQLENKSSDETSNKPNDQNLPQNNKIYKCLSYEKLEKIEEPNKIENPKSLYDGGKIHASKIEINKEILNEEKEEDIYNEMDNDNSFEDESDHNSNSASNKELQMIDENMKSLFSNDSKPAKEISINSKQVKEISNNSKTVKEISNNSITTEDKSTSQEEYVLNYYRSADNLRYSYIQKLVTKALYLPKNKPKTHNSLIIFDWDDTLLPTTFLTQGGVFNENLILTESEQKKIEKLENSALNLLNMAMTKGDVYIITNAGFGWVEYSAEKFYPNVYEILQKISIISARGEWEKQFPGDSRKWKLQSFLSLQKKLNTKLVTNIICLGDSLFEIEAGRVLATCFSEAFVKTIKFKEGPKPEELNKQLLLVANQFNSICAAVKNLTIRVERKKKGQ